MKCSRQNCSSGLEARWYPVLELRAKGSNTVASGAMRQLGTCDACKETTILKDILTNDTWAKIVFTFRASGAAAPERHRTTLRFDRLP